MSALNWVRSVRPGPVRLPPDLVEELSPYLMTGRYAQPLEKALAGAGLTTGSFENDAALFLDRILERYSSVMEAMHAADEMGRPIAFNGEYHGCIY
jgi:hypothetical protein